MAKLILSDTDGTKSDILALHTELLNIRGEIEDLYWSYHTLLGVESYSSLEEQMADMKSLGKLACALDYVNQALSEIGVYHVSNNITLKRDKT